MPVYEYQCDQCEIVFEELFISSAKAKEYFNEHPCPECGENARRVVSATNFQFKGVAEGDPTRKGNSGVHDLDYPTLDKAIGRSANRKWKEYRKEKAARDEARKALGTNTITERDGSVAPVESGVMGLRRQGIKTLRKAIKQNS